MEELMRATTRQAETQVKMEAGLANLSALMANAEERTSGEVSGTELRATGYTDQRIQQLAHSMAERTEAIEGAVAAQQQATAVQQQHLLASVAVCILLQYHDRCSSVVASR